MLFHEYSKKQAKEFTEQEFIVFHQSNCCWINNDIQKFSFMFHKKNTN